METSKLIKTIRSLFPRKVRNFIAELLGYNALSQRIDQLEQHYISLSQRTDQLEQRLPGWEEELWEKSRTRWRAVKPDDDITWGRAVRGDNFIRKVASYDIFHSESSIIEIGPGYGRLLKSMLEQKVPFKSYVGVDISLQNVNYLKESFKGDNILFVHGDIENIILDKSFDIAFSSLTFKHLFPSFEKALTNISRNIVDGGWVFFDLIEGKRQYFEADGVTFIGITLVKRLMIY